MHTSTNRFHRSFALLAAGLPLAGAATVSLASSPAALAAVKTGAEPAKTSRIIRVNLPSGAQRVGAAADVEKFRGALENIARAAGGRVEDVEVVTWTSGGDGTRAALAAALKAAGFQYAPQPSTSVDGGGTITMFLAASDEKKTGVIGIWLHQKGNPLLLAWGTVAPGGGGGSASAAVVHAPARPAPARPAPAGDAGDVAAAPEAARTIQLDASALTVNVMKNEMPQMPAFPKLAEKPGVVRGYVKDTRGRPLAGARIGIRSTLVNQFSGVSTRTDAEGYYEVTAPTGVADFYCAGYAVDYGEGRAGLGLHPADGEADGFATPGGRVENFVLLPYGIADRDGAQDDPRYANNYYGGTVVLNWTVDDDRPVFSDRRNLPSGSEIELTLTPDGPLIDGSAGRAFVLRKPVRNGVTAQLYITNIPVGAYRVAAKLVGGGDLRMREVGPNGGKPFGIEPKSATGSAELLLRPQSAKAESANAAHGNWEHISIALERP